MAEVVLDASGIGSWMRVHLMSPIACRCAGLRASYLERFRSGHVGDLDEQRVALWGLLDDPAFVGCMATMNPRILEELARDHERGRGCGNRSGNARHSERLLYRFLARFVGRNDITGIAGTCFWGRFVDGAADNLVYTPARPSPSKIRLVYASPAHLLHLEQSLRRLHAPDSCRPARAPRTRIVDGRVIDAVSGDALELADGDIEVLRACNARTSLAELAPDAGFLERMERLADEGHVERHATLPPLNPLDRRLADVVDELSALPSVQDAPAVVAGLRELRSLEEQLRTCPSHEIVPLARQADRVAEELGAYRPVDPVATLRRLIAACATDAECRDRVELRVSSRFTTVDGTFHDATTCQPIALTGPQRDIALRFREGASVPEALGAGEPSTESVDAIAALIERTVLCPVRADPWALSACTRSELGFDAWQRTWFEAAIAWLGDLDLPARYARPAVLLRSCRAVEQKSYEAVFPQFNPVSASDRAHRSLAAAGIEAIAAKKDHSFFIIDSLLAGASLDVGAALSADIGRKLEPFLKVLGMRPWEWERKVLLPGLRETIPLDGRVPLAQAMAWSDRWAREWEGPFQGPDAPSLECEYDAVSKTLEISAISFAAEYEEWLADKRLVSTVDLMVLGGLDEIRAGRWRLLVNEAHSTGDGLPETMHVPWTSDLPDVGFTRSHVGSVFPDDLLVMQPLLPTKQAHSIAWQLRGASMAIRNAGTGTAWSGPLVPLGHLDLVRVGEGFEVRNALRTFTFVSLDLSTGPVRTLRYTPRVLAPKLLRLAGLSPETAPDGTKSVPEVRIDGLTVSRRAFVVPAPVMGGRLAGRQGADLLAAGAELRAHLGLPRFVFISLFAEKSFLCDLESLFSLEVLVHALAKNLHEVVVTEMSPLPSELWLEVEGGPVVSEWRFVAALDGPAYSVGSA